MLVVRHVWGEKGDILKTAIPVFGDLCPLCFSRDRYFHFRTGVFPFFTATRVESRT